MKALFLDVDGVLNSRSFATREKIKGLIRLDPVPVRLLNDFIAAEDVEIVLSSTWRILDGDREHLQAALCKPMYGATPRDWHTLPGNLVARVARRSVEIATYLEEHPEITRYMCVDDENPVGWHHPIVNHLVSTTWETGMDADHIKQLRIGFRSNRSLREAQLMPAEKQEDQL